MTERLPFGYSFLAPGYDVAARVCSLGAIPDAQRTVLRALPAVRDLLIIGGGTGSCLRFLPWERIRGQVTFVDISPGMMRRAQRVAYALGVAERLWFLQERVECLNPQQRFDALYTPFFLDQFSQSRCEAILQLLDSVLAPGGLWLHVDFTDNGEGTQAHLYRAVMLPLLYRFFRLTCGIEAATLPNPQTFWQAQRYVCKWKAWYARASISGCVLEKPVGAAD